MSTIQQTYDIPNASEIILEGWGDVQIEQGEQESMTIETDAELLPRLKTAVTGGRLELGLKNPLDHLFHFSHPPIHYHIRVHKLDQVKILGSGTVNCPQAAGGELRLGVVGSGKMRFGSIQADQLEVQIPGSGSVAVESVQAGQFKLSIPGSGQCSAAGTVPQVEARISGSGELRGEELASESANVSIAGSGRVSLAVSRALEVRISGSGQMCYRGTPTLRTHISGSGSVNPL